MPLSNKDQAGASAPVWGLSPQGYAWLVVALLVPVAMLNYLDRQMLATMKASMVTDIPSITNRADWGFVLGCFKWSYAFMSPIGGLIADRFSTVP